MDNNYIYNDPNNVIFLPFQEDFKSVDGQEPTTASAGCVLTTAEKPQGAAASLYCPNASVLYYNNVPVNFAATQDFTFDFYMRFQSGYSGITTQHVSSGSGVAIQRDLIWLAYGSSPVRLNTAPGFLAGQWAHYALVKKGSTFYWFINGVLKHTSSASINLVNTFMLINSRYYNSCYGGPAHYAFVRVSKVARWTAAFTPPLPMIGNVFSIVEKYQDESGKELLPSISTNVLENADHTAAAPNIEDYACIGYKIDGGALQEGSIVELSDVTAEHTIVFVYKHLLQCSCKPTPAGAVIAFARQSVPEGWLECDGRTVSRVGYADLFEAVGELYGSGDGSTTFNLPDLRGEFIRGFDNGRGLDPDRVMGSAQKASLVTGDGNQADGSHLQSIAQDNLKEVCHWDNGQADDVLNVAWYGPVSDSVVAGDHLVVGATRPYNVAMMYCIKY